MLSRFQIITSVYLLILTSVIAGLYIFFVQSQKASNIQENDSTIVNETQPPLLVADDTQLSTLQASIAAMLARIEALESQPPSQVSTASKITPKSTTTSRKEDIYLGSASTTNREWTDTGLEVVINSKDYPATAVVVYEAGLSLNGGEAWSRLKNKTTGAVIDLSEVSHNSSTLTWKSSSSFKLHSGENRYTVELRSTSGETAILSGSRIILSW